MSFHGRSSTTLSILVLTLARVFVLKNVSAAASISLPAGLVDSVPDCALGCLESFVNTNIPPSVCGHLPSLRCLCAHTGANGFTIGEAALTCLAVGEKAGMCLNDASSTTSYGVYRLCVGHPDAAPETHVTLIATSVISVRPVTITMTLAPARVSSVTVASRTPPYITHATVITTQIPSSLLSSTSHTADVSMGANASSSAAASASVPAWPKTATGRPDKSYKQGSAARITGITVGCAAAVVLVVCALLVLYRHRKTVNYIPTANTPRSGTMTKHDGRHVLQISPPVHLQLPGSVSLQPERIEWLAFQDKARGKSKLSSPHKSQKQNLAVLSSQNLVNVVASQESARPWRPPLPKGAQPPNAMNIYNNSPMAGSDEPLSHNPVRSSSEQQQSIAHNSKEQQLQQQQKTPSVLDFAVQPQLPTQPLVSPSPAFLLPTSSETRSQLFKTLNTVQYGIPAVVPESTLHMPQVRLFGREPLSTRDSVVTEFAEDGEESSVFSERERSENSAKDESNSKGSHSTSGGVLYGSLSLAGAEQRWQDDIPRRVSHPETPYSTLVEQLGTAYHGQYACSVQNMAWRTQKTDFSRSPIRLVAGQQPPPQQQQQCYPSTYLTPQRSFRFTKPHTNTGYKCISPTLLPRPLNVAERQQPRNSAQQSLPDVFSDARVNGRETLAE